MFEVIAICGNDRCSEHGNPNVFELEENSDTLVFCGKCKNEITDITMVEKE